MNSSGLRLAGTLEPLYGGYTDYIPSLVKGKTRVFAGKNRYTLVPGKDTIEWTGGTIKLSAKMTLVNGRLMVPSGLLDVLKSPPEAKKAPPARTR